MANGDQKRDASTDRGGSAADRTGCPSCGRVLARSGSCLACGYRPGPAGIDVLDEAAPTVTGSVDILGVSRDFVPPTKPVPQPAAEARRPGASESSVPGADAPKRAPGYAKCPRCETPAGGSKRCDKCGYPLQYARRRKTDDASSRCRACGCRNAASARICVNCGGRVSQD